MSPRESELQEDHGVLGHSGSAEKGRVGNEGDEGGGSAGATKNVQVHGR